MFDKDGGGEKVVEEDVEAVIQCVDADGDGFINYSEFTKVILAQKSSNGQGAAGTDIDY